MKMTLRGTICALLAFAMLPLASCGGEGGAN